jgi:hypothetical protein
MGQIEADFGCSTQARAVSFAGTNFFSASVYPDIWFPGNAILRESESESRDLPLEK